MPATPHDRRWLPRPSCALTGQLQSSQPSGVSYGESTFHVSDVSRSPAYRRFRAPGTLAHPRKWQRPDQPVRSALPGKIRSGSVISSPASFHPPPLAGRAPAGRPATADLTTAWPCWQVGDHIGGRWLSLGPVPGRTARCSATSRECRGDSARRAGYQAWPGSGRAAGGATARRMAGRISRAARRAWCCRRICGGSGPG
jgi:hypothetical protein